MESTEKSEKTKYLKIGGLLIVINILLFSFFTQGLGGLKENFIVALYTVVICYTLLAFILGAIVALLPFNKLTYKKKYWRASLLSNLFIQAVFTCCLVWLSIITIFDL
jgi:VIT1/CCC1 family predicted Fe2+/Mn2+ transporter